MASPSKRMRSDNIQAKVDATKSDFHLLISHLTVAEDHLKRQQVGSSAHESVLAALRLTKNLRTCVESIERIHHADVLQRQAALTTAVKPKFKAAYSQTDECLLCFDERFGNESDAGLLKLAVDTERSSQDIPFAVSLEEGDVSIGDEEANRQL